MHFAYKCILCNPWPQVLHAFLLAQASSLFKLIEITKVAADSQVPPAMSANSSLAECSNLNDHVIGYAP
jgi:hypothetical protein